MADASKKLAANGWADGHKLWVTEIGVASDDGRALTDNYGWPTAMTYTQAGAALTKAVGELKTLPTLGGIIVYASQDRQLPGATNQREDYFGIVRKDNAAKGAYTSAVKALAAG